MSSERVQQILFIFAPTLAAFIAGVIATRRRPSGSVRSAILHFAAGVVFSVVAVELIPDLLRDHSTITTALGFATGVAAMLGVRALLERDEDGDAKTTPAGGAEQAGASGKGDGRPLRALVPIAMLVAIGVDLAVDGALLGVGFAAGAKEGRMLALALGTELVALALATIASLQGRGVPSGRALRVLAGLLCVFAVSATVGTLALGSLAGTALVFVLSFGAAALLFLVTEELLVEAHEEKEKAWMTATFFLGFLLFLVIGMAG